MYLTDEEARREVCPHMTWMVNESDVINFKVSPIYAQQSCRGSDCKMAWRWKSPQATFPNGAIDFFREQTPRGYCGLAGKPEA
jgi:hypothetical protein